MAISCVVEYSEDYGHERFYGITPVKRQDSMGYQGRSPWLVRSEIRRPASHVATAIYLAHRPTTAYLTRNQPRPATPTESKPIAIPFSASPSQNKRPPPRNIRDPHLTKNPRPEDVKSA